MLSNIIVDRLLSTMASLCIRSYRLERKIKHSRPEIISNDIVSNHQLASLVHRHSIPVDSTLDFGWSESETFV